MMETTHFNERIFFYLVLFQWKKVLQNVKNMKALKKTGASTV